MLDSFINKEKALNYLHHSDRYISEALSNPRLVSAAKVVENFKNPEVLGENVGESDKAEDKRKAVDSLGERYGVKIRVVEKGDEITDADGDKNFTR